VKAGGKQSSVFNGLQGVISQKIVLFITTAVRTSKPVSTLKEFEFFPHGLCTHFV
jgi:hypothetical protein